MKLFESALAQATARSSLELLGAVGLVVSRNGTVLYRHAAGNQTLSPASPPLSPDCTFELGSAGKFVTHLAALRVVDAGFTTLDAPVSSILPELGALPVISAHPDQSASKHYMLRPPSKQITLRHLLLHASGIGDGQDPLVKAWKADQPAKPPSDSKIVDLFSIPLLFEPGEGYAYGASIYWTDLFLARLLKLPVGGANHDLIFKPLNLTSSTARPQDSTEIRGRLLQMVERQPDSSLAPAEHQAQSFVSNAPDLGKIFAVLLSPKPTLLSKESVELLFTGQFPPSSKQISQLQSFTEGYGAPAGIPPTLKSPPVNWSMAGLIVDSTLSLADLPAGSVTWDGMPNVVWVMNREKGLGMVFATQLLPTGDTKTVEIAQTFFREAWATFG